MNERAVRWIERLPRRWGGNAAIFGAGIFLLLLLKEPPPFLTGKTPLSTALKWAVALTYSIVMAIVFFGGLAYLIGMVERRRLRQFRPLPDESAFTAIQRLPLRYFVFGLVLYFV
jgi:hypothetical protein